MPTSSLVDGLHALKRFMQDRGGLVFAFAFTADPAQVRAASGGLDVDIPVGLMADASLVLMDNNVSVCGCLPWAERDRVKGVPDEVLVRMP
jgi:hypothetical protein